VIREPKPALLRVRLPTRVLARLHELAAEKNTDISELARQALYDKYPQLREAPAPVVMREEPSNYSQATRDDRLAAAMEQQTAILRELLERSTKPTGPRLVDEPDAAAESDDSAKPRRKAH
jgi:hypothetical protein